MSWRSRERTAVLTALLALCAGWPGRAQAQAQSGGQGQAGTAGPTQAQGQSETQGHVQAQTRAEAPAAKTATGEAQPPRDRSYRHHGPFVHLTVGPGVRFLFASDPTNLGGSTKLVGAATLAGLFFGWTIRDNLMVHGQLIGGIASALRGIGGDLGGSDVSMGYLWAGAGLTAYGVTDVFFTPMIGYVNAGWVAGSGGVPLPSSLDGVMTGIQFGKEWWIGRHFLAGVGGQLDYQWLRGGDDTWHGLGAVAIGSLTYN